MYAIIDMIQRGKKYIYISFRGEKISLTRFYCVEKNGLKKGLTSKPLKTRGKL
jgi:hypothetical protein